MAKTNLHFIPKTMTTSKPKLTVKNELWLEGKKSQHRPSYSHFDPKQNKYTAWAGQFPSMSQRFKHNPPLDT